MFGGSFDPPHVGHLIVAQDAMERLGLDRVRFVPARLSPFKVDEEPGVPPELRLRMVEAAVEGHPAFEVSRAELDREGPSWTVETLRGFREEDPSVEWTLLLGVDQWVSFGRWREPEAVAELARIVVLSREGSDSAGASAGPELPHSTLEVTRIDVSSTQIRRRIREGRSIRYLVPEPVRALIEANGLYPTC